MGLAVSILEEIKVEAMRANITPVVICPLSGDYAIVYH